MNHADMKPSVGGAIADPGAIAALNPATRTGARATHVLKDLLFVLTARDIKIKYKQSAMGLMWAVLMPAIIVGSGMLIRVAMSKMSGTPLHPDSLASISVKALPWAFVVGAIRFATSSLTANANLVTKINCPRIAFPVSAVLSALFDLAIALLPLTLLLAWCEVGVSYELLWVPVIAGFLVLFVTGLSIALSAANLFFRDVKYLVEVMLTFAIFFTPVLYDAEMLGPWRFWVMLNPLSPLLEALRSTIVLNEAPELHWLAYSGIVSVLAFAAGWWMFRKLEPAFADSV